MSGLVGTILGGYNLHQELGQGALGVVYRGISTRDNQVVAIRVFRQELGADPVFQRKLLDLTGRLAGLQHDQLARVSTAGSEHGWLFQVMEYRPEGSLLTVLRQDGVDSLNLLQRLELARRSALALEALHAAGLVHGAVSPQNLLRAPSRNDLVPVPFDLKLSDGGLALLLGPHTSDPAYIAPERWRQGVADARSDIYALGVVIYQLFAGSVPFHARSREDIAHKHAVVPPPPLSQYRQDLPTGLEPVIDRCLAKDPAARYASASDLALELRQVMDPLLPPAQVTIPTPPAPPKRRVTPSGLRVRLLTIEGVQLAEQELTEAGLRVGRDQQNELKLPPHDAAVSRQHALVHWDGQRVTVEDRSSNGTLLAGRKLAPQQPQVWHVGEVVHLGGYRLELIKPAPPRVPPTVVVPVAPAPVQADPPPPVLPPVAPPDPDPWRRYGALLVALAGIASIILALAVGAILLWLLPIGVILLLAAVVLSMRANL